MSHALESMKLARVVVREDFSRNRMEILVRDVKAAVEVLDSLDQKELEAHR
jgi:glutamate decarboxylase